MLLCVANLCHLCPWAIKKNKEEEDGQWEGLEEWVYSLERVHGLGQRQLAISYHLVALGKNPPDKLGHFGLKQGYLQSWLCEEGWAYVTSRVWAGMCPHV